MTIKVRDLRRPGSITTTTYNVDGSVQSNSISATNKLLGEYQYRDSVDTGAFTPGILRLNPCCIFKVSGFSVPGVMKQTKPYTPLYCGLVYVVGDIACLHAIYQPTPSLPTWYSTLHDLSRAKVQAKVKEPDLGLGQMIAELHETISFLKNPLKKSLALWQKFARRRYNQAGDVAELYFKTASDAWLAYRYGLMPLILDCANFMEYVEKQNSMRSSRMRRVNKSVKMETVNTSITNTGLAGFNYPVTCVTKTQVKSTSHIYFKLRSDSVIGLKMYALGLHPSQWPSLVWEKTMFSFIADWFVNFGTWIQAISPNVGKEILGACSSQVITKEETWSLGYPTYCTGMKAPSVEAYVASSYRKVTQSLTRRVDSSSLILPRLNVEWLNIKRTLDTLALTSNMIVRLIRRK